MKKALSIFLIAIVAAFFAACPAGTETGTNANENANAEAPAKDLKATLMDVDKSFQEAGKKKDGKFFEANLTDNFAGVMSDGFADKAMILKFIADNPCEPGDESKSDVNVTELADGIAVFTAKGSGERTCDGKKETSEEQYALLYVKDGDTWKVAYYQGIQLPAKEEAKSDDAAKEDKPAAEGEAKKEEAKPEAKEEPKKEEAPMTPKFTSDDDLARTLAGKEGELWAAWMKKDTKPFEEAFAPNFSEMTMEGLASRADVLKQIAENKCEITGTSVSESHAIMINDNYVLFIYKGSAKGKCGDMTDPSGYDASIWMKDGDNWKVVFHAESPITKS